MLYDHLAFIYLHSNLAKKTWKLFYFMNQFILATGSDGSIKSRDLSSIFGSCMIHELFF